MKNSPKRKFLKMKVLICKNSWHKSYSNFKFWLFWQQPTALAKMQLFQILLPASQWRIPASRFVYISHIAQPTLTTEHFTDLGKLNFPMWFGFRLEPTFNTAPSPSMNDAQFKSGQN